MSSAFNNTPECQHRTTGRERCRKTPPPSLLSEDGGFIDTRELLRRKRADQATTLAIQALLDGKMILFLFTDIYFDDGNCPTWAVINFTLLYRYPAHSHDATPSTDKGRREQQRAARGKEKNENDTHRKCLRINIFRALDTRKMWMLNRRYHLYFIGRFTPVIWPHYGRRTNSSCR